MEKPDDKLIIEKVLGGDTAAYAQLVDRHKNLVFTIAVRVARNREDAEEIAQDVFVKAYQKLSEFKQASRFSTWLYRIAYNEAVSHTRKKVLSTVTIEEQITENIPEDALEEEVMGLDRHQQKSVIEKVLHRLPEEDQLLITLFYMGERPVSDISEVTGLSESNVKVKLHRIRKKIYKEIKEILQNKNLAFI
jgi:RNA polymerase sigma-70 factor, ECF subfamily